MKPPGIYQLIEEALLMSESPLTCDDLFDRAEIKALAPSASSVSDYLGHMWRKGLVQRWHSNDPTSTAIYTYTLKSEEEAPRLTLVKQPDRTSAPPDCRVSTDGPNVIIEVDDLKITIQRK